MLTVAAACLLFFANSAVASIGRVSSPQVQKGLMEVEYSATRDHDADPSINNRQSHRMEVEYGFTDRFMMGVEGTARRESGLGTAFTAIGVEAQYEFTTQGDWWLNSAMQAEYGFGIDHGESDAVEISLIASYDYKDFRLLANLDMERNVDKDADNDVTVATALQARYGVTETLNLGLEWQAEHGPLKDLGRPSDSEYYLGPIASGQLMKLGNGVVDYTIGYYWGLNDVAADRAARLQIGYEFAF